MKGVAFGVPTAATVIVFGGLVAGGIIPQELVDQIPSETLSEWIGPPGIILLLYETVRRGLGHIRSLTGRVDTLEGRQRRIARELGIHLEGEE